LALRGFWELLIEDIDIFIGISSFGVIIGGISIWICEEEIIFFTCEASRRIAKLIASLVRILMFPDHFSFVQLRYKYLF
jgi:hypothetical protein